MIAHLRKSSGTDIVLPCVKVVFTATYLSCEVVKRRYV